MFFNICTVPSLISIFTFIITCKGSSTVTTTKQSFAPLQIFKIVGKTKQPATVLPIQICPPQTEEEIYFNEKNKSLKCNFTHPPDDDPLTCNKKPEPFLTDGRLDSAYICHEWIYIICSISYKPTSYYDEEWEKIGHQNQNDKEQLILANAFPLSLFVFCWSEKPGVHFTLHSISTSLNTPIDIFEPSGQSITYLIENQKEALKIIFGKDDIENTDYLIPQMLVPARDILPSLAQKKHDSDNNMRPQWNSLNTTWRQITDFIWYAETTQPWTAMHYTGATGILKINKKEIILGKGKEREKRIPLYWWRVVHIEPNQNILIVMHNTSSESKIGELKKACKKSICARNGWGEIIKIAKKNPKAIVYCCEADKRSFRIMGVSNLAKIFKKKNSILQLLLSSHELNFINRQMNFNEENHR